MRTRSSYGLFPEYSMSISWYVQSIFMFSQIHTYSSCVLHKKEWGAGVGMLYVMLQMLTSIHTWWKLKILKPRFLTIGLECLIHSNGTCSSYYSPAFEIIQFFVPRNASARMFELYCKNWIKKWGLFEDAFWTQLISCLLGSNLNYLGESKFI